MNYFHVGNKKTGLNGGMKAEAKSQESKPKRDALNWVVNSIVFKNLESSALMVTPLTRKGTE